MCSTWPLARSESIIFVLFVAAGVVAASVVAASVAGGNSCVVDCKLVLLNSSISNFCLLFAQL